MIELMEEIKMNNNLYRCTQILDIDGELIYICYDLNGRQKIYVREIEDKKFEQVKNKRILKAAKDMTTIPSIIKYIN